MALNGLKSGGTPFAPCGVAAGGCRGRHASRSPQCRPCSVEAIEAATDTVPNRMSFVSSVESNFDALIEPRVNGYLVNKYFSSGMPVRKGQLLFTIDPNLLSTTLLSAEASLESARAQEVWRPSNNYERAVPLARIDAISQTQLDQYTAEVRRRRRPPCVRPSSRCATHGCSVGYTRSCARRSTVSSNTGDAHAGDYVVAGTQFSVLTSISNIDTLTVDVAIPMAEYLRAAGGRGSIYDNEGLLSDIRLTLADGTRYPYGGLYDYTRKDVSSSTGTLVLVVMFPNPDRSLKPGQFARVSANVGPVQPRVIVPQQSVSQAQGVNSVWVVRPDSTAAYRRVVLGDTYGTMWCVDEGLAEGEQVVTAGQQKLRNGMKVIPVIR